MFSNCVGLVNYILTEKKQAAEFMCVVAAVLKETCYDCRVTLIKLVFFRQFVHMLCWFEQYFGLVTNYQSYVCAARVEVYSGDCVRKLYYL